MHSQTLSRSPLTHHYLSTLSNSSRTRRPASGTRVWEVRHSSRALTVHATRTKIRIDGVLFWVAVLSVSILWISAVRLPVESREAALPRRKRLLRLLWAWTLRLTKRHCSWALTLVSLHDLQCLQNTRADSTRLTRTARTFRSNT